MAESKFKYEIGENERSITISGVSADGQPTRMFFEWKTAELMDKNLSKTLTAAEKTIRELKRLDENVAGMAAKGATSKIKRLRLPFGKELTYSIFKNHEYDEAALMLGPVKFVFQLTTSGKIRWGTVKVERKSMDEKIVLGIGGAHNAWFLSVK